jgi:hypothetical protein
VDFMGEVVAKDEPVKYNLRLNKKLPNTILVRHRDNFLGDGSRPNKSIGAIVRTKPGKHLIWRGPVIVYAKEGLDSDALACKDLDMVDFRHVADYFLSY